MSYSIYYIRSFWKKTTNRGRTRLNNPHDQDQISYVSCATVQGRFRQIGGNLSAPSFCKGRVNPKFRSYEEVYTLGNPHPWHTYVNCNVLVGMASIRTIHIKTHLDTVCAASAVFEKKSHA